jgi:hypothetical protein
MKNTLVRAFGREVRRRRIALGMSREEGRMRDVVERDREPPSQRLAEARLASYRSTV